MALPYWKQTSLENTDRSKISNETILQPTKSNDNRELASITVGSTGVYRPNAIFRCLKQWSNNFFLYERLKIHFQYTSTMFPMPQQIQLSLHSLKFKRISLHASTRRPNRTFLQWIISSLNAEFWEFLQDVFCVQWFITQMQSNSQDSKNRLTSAMSRIIYFSLLKFWIRW